MFSSCSAARHFWRAASRGEGGKGVGGRFHPADQPQAASTSPREPGRDGSRDLALARSSIIAVSRDPGPIAVRYWRWLLGQDCLHFGTKIGGISGLV